MVKILKWFSTLLRKRQTFLLWCPKLIHGPNHVLLCSSSSIHFPLYLGNFPSSFGLVNFYLVFTPDLKCDSQRRLFTTTHLSFLTITTRVISHLFILLRLSLLLDYKVFKGGDLPDFAYSYVSRVLSQCLMQILWSINFC